MILALVVHQLTERMRAATLAAAAVQQHAASREAPPTLRAVRLRGLLVECLAQLGYRVDLTRAA